MTGYIRIIPIQPSWLPDEAAISAATQLLAQFTPRAIAVGARVTEQVKIVDPGENFERILCPACGSELGVPWWGDQLDALFDPEHGFVVLDVVTPCCGQQTTLNDLNYTWACGFARLVLEAEDYDRDPLDSLELDQLASLLGCGVRQILAHY